jgi:hypothetical protein
MDDPDRPAAPEETPEANDPPPGPIGWFVELIRQALLGGFKAALLLIFSIPMAFLKIFTGGDDPPPGEERD